MFLNRSGRPPYRPHLENLEDRTLLNNRFVVPVGVVPDSVTTFSTLATALISPGLAPGNVIQIQPGSAPGAIVNANVPFVSNLTIQGDPSVAASELPPVIVNDAVTLMGGKVGFTLRNVNVVLQGGGLTFNVNGAVVNSVLTCNFAGTALNLSGTTQFTLSGTTIAANNGANGGDVMFVNPIMGANNLISNNVFISSAPVNHTLLRYLGSGPITDRVVGNTFLGNPGFAGRPLFLSDALGIVGLSLTDNIFRDSDSGQVAIAVGVGTQNMIIARNVITLTGNPAMIGINVVGGGPVATGLVISNNQINTGGTGTGIQFARTLAGGGFAVRVEGNDLHANKIGVFVSGNLAGSVTGIDLGGGAFASRGANNFRGITTPAAFDHGAVVTSAVTADGPVSAQGNLFNVADPETVIFDQADSGTLANVNAAGNLTGNAAYVEALYLEFFKRVGDVANPGDAGGWVTALNGGTPASVVAGSLIRSAEGLGVRVDGLYRQFLRREADPAGRANFVNSLVNGATVEQAITVFVTAEEYRTRFGSDGAFVQSLYGMLLGRVGSPAEVAGWVGMLPGVTRAVVAASILVSTEYRELVVRRDYAQLLNRTVPPTPAEVTGWVTTGLDQLSLEVAFAAGPEFQMNG